MTHYDPKKHHRQSTRLKGFDYSESGAYFVTLVTHERECLFGGVTESGEMVLNEIGMIVVEEWNRSGIIMPSRPERRGSLASMI
jgi:putative transposase